MAFAEEAVRRYLRRMRCRALLMLLGCCSLAHAQVYFGNRVGLSVGKQVLDQLDGYEGINIYNRLAFQALGGHGALTVEFPLGERTGVVAEVGYVEKGYLQPKDAPVVVERRLIRIGYADLGALFRWSPLTGNVRPEVFAGPNIARSLRLRDESRPDMLLSDVDAWWVRYQEPDVLGAWEVSAVAGAGLVFQPGVARIHVNWRYIHGFTNVYDREVAFTDIIGVPFAKGGMLNRTQLISIGFSIPLAREAWTAPSTTR